MWRQARQHLLKNIKNRSSLTPTNVRSIIAPLVVVPSTAARGVVRLVVLFLAWKILQFVVDFMFWTKTFSICVYQTKERCLCGATGFLGKAPICPSLRPRRWFPPRYSDSRTLTPRWPSPGSGVGSTISLQWPVRRPLITLQQLRPPGWFCKERKDESEFSVRGIKILLCMFTLWSRSDSVWVLEDTTTALWSDGFLRD